MALAASFFKSVVVRNDVDYGNVEATETVDVHAGGGCLG